MRFLRLPARIWTILLGSTATLLAVTLAARFALPNAPLAPMPALLSTAPLAGAADVLPRSPITLTFAGPMNRTSVVGALRLDPPTPGALAWSSDAQTLTFTPAEGLLPATTYTLTLDATAQDRWWRPLPAPVQVAFRTAPQPAVLSAIPTGPDTPRESSFALIFSQPMVEPTTLDRDISLPQLSFSPALPYRARWIATDTLLIRPITPLPAAQAFRAVVAADLTDTRGIALGEPFQWEFSTAWPRVLERTPPPGARSVGLQSPLSFTLDAPLDIDLLRASLTISPPIPGELRTEAAGSRQIVTFTPSRDWAAEQTYTVRLVAPAGSRLSAPPDLRWSFTSEARPALAAFFPGQNQLLPSGEAIRLVFTTPMQAEDLAAGLSFDPPIDDLPIRVNATEARLTPALAPSTNYTITLAADTPDRNGTPLGNPIVMRLRTPAAPPALTAIDAAVGLVTLPVSQTASIAFERINLSQLDLTLYQLDPPTLRLALASGPSGLTSFVPERYNQPQLRRWRVPLNDPADTPTQSTIPIGLNDSDPPDPLDPGAYLLRVTTSEGPRADLLLIVSSVQLTLRYNDAQVLVWATDLRTGTPQANLPITLYANDLLITSGTTDAAGIFELPLRRNPPDARYLALSESPDLAVVRTDWSLDPTIPAPPASYQMLVWPQRASYTPGEQIEVTGRVRRLAVNGNLVLPGTPNCRLQILAPGSPAPPNLLASTCQISNGRLNANAQLNPRLLPGDYVVRVSIADTASEFPISVSSADTFNTTLAVSEQRANDLIITATSSGLPLADAQINWNVTLSPLPPPIEDRTAGFRFNPAQTVPAPLIGSAASDPQGRIVISLPTVPEQVVSYRLTATLDAPGNARAQLTHTGTLTPAEVAHLGLRLPRQFVSTTDRAVVDLITRAGDGAPRAGVPIELTVVRGTTSDTPPVLVRRVTSSADGSVSSELVPLDPGIYTVTARADTLSTRATLWVTAPNFNAWNNPDGVVRIIPEQPTYPIGATARLLVTSPWPTATLLLTTERGDLRAANVQTLSAGQVLTFTITPDLAPGFSLGAILSNGSERRIGNTTINVPPANDPLILQISTDRSNYLPAATATLSVSLPITSRNAELLISLAPADMPDQTLPNAGVGPKAPPPLASAGHPPQSTVPRTTTINATAGPPGFLVPSSTGAGGSNNRTLQFDLPAQAGNWRIHVFAIEGVNRVVHSSTVVAINPPIERELLAPATLRVGDEADLVVNLTNNAPISQTVRLELDLRGADLITPAATEQTILLAPFTQQPLTWNISAAPDATQLDLQLTLLSNEQRSTITRTIPVLAASAHQPSTSNTITASGPLSLPLPQTPAREVVLAPSLPAALAAVADQIVAQPAPSQIDHAAHAIIATRLATIGAPPGAPHWQARAFAALTQLHANQNSDGGWGWWAQTPSDPFVSAFVVEALTSTRALPGNPPNPDARALAYLTRSATNAEPNLHAYLAYAANRAGQPLSSAASLRNADLDPAGTAYLALALPANQAAPLVERLLTLPDPPWYASTNSSLPNHPVSVTASVISALRLQRPGAPPIALAEAYLRSAWNTTNWDGAFNAARVALALPLSLPTAGPNQLRINNTVLISTTTPLTRTVRFQIADSVPGELLTLNVATTGTAPYLLAYRSAAPETPVRTPAAVISVSYHHPITGVVVAPTQFRAGQLLEIRLQTLALQPISGAQISLALPSALIPLEMIAQAPFIHAEPDPAQATIQLSAPRISTGIAQQRLLVRVGARGSFTIPPPHLTTPDHRAPESIVVLAPRTLIVR
jgi:hypothetical protein